VLPPHDPPPPDEAAEPPDKDPPKQIQAPANARGPTESPWGEGTQRATWRNGQSQTRRHECMWPLREAHGHPPDLPDPYPRSSIAPEHAVVDPKAHVVAYEARRPVPDEHMSARPEPWPGTGSKIEDPDACTRASVSLEGEQNIILPFVGSKQYVAPCTPHISPLSVVPPPPKILAPGIPPGEEATSIRCAAADPVAEGLEESGGVWEATSTIHAPTKDTTGIELVGTAERAAAAEPEALEPWAGDEAWRRLHTAP
jgi:hypothetical protein